MHEEHFQNCKVQLIYKAETRGNVLNNSILTRQDFSMRSPSVLKCLLCLPTLLTMPLTSSSMALTFSFFLGDPPFFFPADLALLSVLSLSLLTSLEAFDASAAMFEEEEEILLMILNTLFKVM